LRGRQDAQAVERAGLRLKLLKQQAAAGDIILLFEDESEALTHPYLAYVWAKPGADLRIPAPGQAKRRAILGVLDSARRRMLVETSTTKHSTDFIALLERLDDVYGPRPGGADKPVVMVIETVPSTPARPLPPRSPRVRGSPRSGCPSTPPNSTTWKTAGATSNNISWPIKPSTPPRPWMTKSITPYPP